MKERKPLHKFLGVMLGILVFSLMSINVIKNLNIYQESEKKVFGFFSMVRYSLIDYPVSTFTGFTKDFASFWQQRDINDILRDKVDYVASVELENKQLKKELKELSELNDLEDLYFDYDLISTKVLNRSYDSWKKELIINVGSNKGVAVNDAVIAAKGLVGRVIKVEKDYSVVSLITSNSDYTKFAISIHAGEENINGIIDSYDAETGSFVIQLMEASKAIEPNQEVSTSGLGGEFPQGLYLGRVSKVEAVSKGVGLDVHAKSSVNFNSLNYLKVVKKR